MNVVMNSKDIRSKIWSFLRSSPTKLCYQSKITYLKDNMKFGDIFEDQQDLNLFILDIKNNFFLISQDNKINIPISITKYIINAVEFFNEILYLDDIYISLRNDDIFIKDNFGNLPYQWDYKFFKKDNVPYLKVIYNDVRREKDFIVGFNNLEDIFNCYKVYKKKQTKFYIHLTIENDFTKFSLSNYEFIYDQNYFEFYCSKENYSEYLSLKWIKNLINKNQLPIYWDVNLVSYLKNPTYVVLEINGPFYERQNILSILKKQYSNLHFYIF